MTTPKHICPDCGRPVYQSFVARGLGYVHADCEIARLTKQRDELREASDEMLAVFLDDADAVDPVDMRQRMEREAKAVKRLRAAIAACEEVKP